MTQKRHTGRDSDNSLKDNLNIDRTESWTKVKNKERKFYYQSLKDIEIAIRVLDKTVCKIIDSYGYGFLHNLREKSYINNDVSNDLERIQLSLRKLEEIYIFVSNYQGRCSKINSCKVINIKPIKSI